MNDLMMEFAVNQDFSPSDLLAYGGFTAENTTLGPREAYLSDPTIKEAFSTQDGQFDRDRFNSVYNMAQLAYLNLDQINVNLLALSLVKHHRDNIFAPASEPISDKPDFAVFTILNPTRQTMSLIDIGKLGDRLLSYSEIAQSNKVRLNPQAPDSEAIWGDAPNDKNTFQNLFGSTLVLALWDYDADKDGNRVTDPSKAYYKKGELKYNEDGENYYEVLDGRNVYGRQVLSRMNVLTTDGSKWNKFDFFDSDDLELKSILGTTMKNLALVGTMFIKYAGPWVAGLSVAIQMAGMLSTLGKMGANTLGFDSPILNEIEGWSQSMNRQNAKTEYAQNNVWCWENMINLIGDVAGQLKEQRFIFEKLPTVVKGEYFDYSTKASQAKLAQYQKELFDLNKTKLAKISKSAWSQADAARKQADIITNITYKAQKNLDSFIKGYRTIGEITSKGYMTLLTVVDTYGEAINAGADPVDATLLTLGYAAGEYALLSTGLGDWILPELRMEKYKSKAIIKALLKINDDKKEIISVKDAFNGFIKSGDKRSFAKKIFEYGKDIAKAEYANGVKSLPATVAAGLGEGFEEVSEEFLADFFKGCYNTISWLRGNDTRLDSFGFSWEDGKRKWSFTDIRDRYGMSLVGGAVGGSLTNAFTNFKSARDYNNMSYQTAVQELVYMIRNNEIDDFLDTVDKSTLGSTKFTNKFEYINGEYTQVATEDPTKSIDALNKDMIYRQVQYIESVLEAHGGNLSDESLIDRQLVPELRSSAFQQTATAGRFLKKYNTLVAELAKAADDLKNLVNEPVDTNGDNTISDRERRHAGKTLDERIAQLDENSLRLAKDLQEKIKQLDKEIQALTSGKFSPEFYQDSLFEMTSMINQYFDALTFPLFVEQKTGRKFDEVSDAEKKELRALFENFKEMDAAERVHLLSQAYRQIAEASSHVIQGSAQTYEERDAQIINTVSLLKRLFGIETNETSEETTQFFQNRHNTAASAVAVELLKGFYEAGTAEDTLIKTIASALDGSYNDPDNPITDELWQEWNTQLLGLIGDQFRKSAAAWNENERIKKTPVAKGAPAPALNPVPDNIISRLVRLGQLNYEVKNQLTNILKFLQDSFKNNPIMWDAVYEWGEDEIGETSDYLDALINEVLATSNTPIEQVLNEFSISTSGKSINIQQLIEKVNTMLNEQGSEVTFSEDLLRSVNEALFILDMFAASIQGARVDNIGLGNLYGFNLTLNELTSSQLATINGKTAEQFLQDVDLIRNKLSFIKNLHVLNSGQKLLELKKIEINKNLLIYRRLKIIVNIDDLKDLEGIQELKQALEAAKILEQLDKDNSVANLPKKLKVSDEVAFWKQQIAIEDAVYNFFSKNSKDALKKIININVFKNMFGEPDTTLLTSETNYFDDISFIWWLASHAAIKSSAFYNEYRQIIGINKKIAPIATLELAAFNAYASILNGNKVREFFDVYKQQLFDTWKNMSVNDRKAILTKLKLNTRYAESKYEDYIFSIFPSIKYTNIVLTDGIPGSGKTTGVDDTIITMLKAHHPKILKDVLIVHGTDTGSEVKENDTTVNGTKLKTSLGLEKATVQTIYTFMKSIDPTWTVPSKNAYGEYNYKPGDIAFNSQGELESTHNPSFAGTVPSLIIIDEILKFSAADLDIINKFAQAHGITIIASGDFDQSGINGHTKIADDASHPFKGITAILSLHRNNFIHTMKLGVSMRTDNKVSSLNIQAMLLYLKNPYGVFEFRYFLDLTGIYGTKVYLPKLTDLMKADIALLILNSKEKVNFIYYDTESELYKYLHSTYGDKINFLYGNSALGTEGKFYIIELNTTLSEVDYLKAVYTGISRAEQGSILVCPPSHHNMQFSNAAPLTENIVESLTEKGIEQFSTKKKKNLDEALNGSTETIEPTPRSAESTTFTPPPTKYDARPAFDALINIFPDIADLKAILDKYTDKYNLYNTQEDFKKSSEFSTIAQELYDKIKEMYGDEVADLVKSALIDEFPTLKPETIDAIKNAIPKSTVDTLDKIKANSIAALTKYYKDLGYTDDEIANYIKIFENNFSLIVGGNIGDIIELYYKIEERDGNKIIVFHPELYTLQHDNITFKPHRVKAGDQFTIQLGLTQFQAQVTKVNAQGGVEEAINVATGKLIVQNGKFVSLQEDPVEDNTHADDSDLPIVDETATENDDKSALDDDNQDPPVLPEHTSLGLKMLMHSFRSLESGVETGPDGKPFVSPEDKPWHDMRIDSANGLMHLDDKNGKPEHRLVVEYLRHLMRLLNILLNVESKAEMLTMINRFLRGRYGVEGTYITFALKSSAIQNDQKSGYYWRDKANKFGKKNTETSYVELETPLDGPVSYKNLVAIIGNADGDFLEIPVLTLNSPITLLHLTTGEEGSKVDVYPLAKSVFDKRFAETNSYVKALEAVIDACQSDPNYEALVDLCKLFLYTFDGIEFEHDTEWTPAKDLELKGPEFSISKGLYQVNKNFLFGLDEHVDDIPWQTITHFGENERFRVTEKMYINEGVTELNRTNNDAILLEKAIKPGKPFVLVTTDPTLETDTAMYEYYMKLLRGETDKIKVKRVYVMSPKVSIKGYLENYIAKLLKQLNVPKLGNAMTPYVMIKALMKNPSDTRFRDILKSRIESDAFATLDAELDRLMSIEADINKITDPIDRRLALLKFVKTYLCQPYSKIASFGTLHLCNIFKYAIFKAAYDISSFTLSFQEVPTNVAIIDQILTRANISTQYHSEWSKGNPRLGYLVAFDQDIGYTTLDGKPYLIHGKIDPPVFLGDMSKLVKSFLKNVKYDEVKTEVVDGKTVTKYYKNGQVIWYSADRNAYQNGHSNPRSVSKPHAARVATLTNLLKKVGLSLEDINKIILPNAESSLQSYQESLVQACKVINETVPNTIAFIKGKNEMIVANTEGKFNFGTHKELFDFKYSGDVVEFKVKVDSDVVTCTYKHSNNLNERSLSILETPKQEPPVTIDFGNIAIDAAVSGVITDVYENLLNKGYDSYGQLFLLKITNTSELLKVIDDYMLSIANDPFADVPYGMPEVISELEEIKKKTKPEYIPIIDTLINIERYLLQLEESPVKEEQCNPPINITKFI